MEDGEDGEDSRRTTRRNIEENSEEKLKAEDGKEPRLDQEVTTSSSSLRTYGLNRKSLSTRKLYEEKSIELRIYAPHRPKEGVRKIVT
ncbi:MAG: hypothetical protein MMC33_009666, partial [Icmadophila ericetorum]|nr:hypothetical protein [Icmadophila ericetorum]